MEKGSQHKNAYPLDWPAGWPRTDAADRRYGRFNKKRQVPGRSWTTSDDVTIAEAISRINSELEAFDGPQRMWSRIDPERTVISSNLRVRRSDGLPASSQAEPEDPGVAVYFELDGKSQCIPCDAYTKTAQNLAAVAATLAALRTLERHGSGIMERAFTGFQALPDPNRVNWREILDYLEGNNIQEVKSQYRKAARLAHPDHGGNDKQMARVNAALAQAKQELKEG